MLAPAIKLALKKVLKKVALKVAKKTLGFAIKAFLLRYAIKFTKHVFTEFPKVIEGSKAKDKLDAMVTKLSGLAVYLVSIFSGGGGGGVGGGSASSDNLSGEEKSAEKELDSEREDDSSDIGFVLLAAEAVMGSSVTSAKRDAPKSTFNLPDFFPLPDIMHSTKREGRDAYGKKKTTTGRKIKVGSSDAFRYKNAEMSSAVYGNPLNVRPPRNKSGEIIDDKWEGQSGHYFSGSGDFMSFSDPFYSFRASATTLMTYQKRDGKYSIHDWIYTYCPTFDPYAGSQQTQAYVNDVVSIVNRTGLLSMTVTEFTPLNITDRNTFIAVMKGMAWHESWLEVSADYLGRVYDAMFLGKPIPLQTEGGGYFTGSVGGEYVRTRSVVTRGAELQYADRPVEQSNSC